MSANAVGPVLEHGSRNADKSLDSRLLLYRTMDVHTSDIAKVVNEINEALVLAKYMDERLSPLLLEDLKGFDYALASLSSVNGKMLKYLTTSSQNFRFTEVGAPKTPGLRDLMAGQQKPQSLDDIGIKIDEE